MPKPLSLKEKKQRLQQVTFIGRAQHLAAFRENIVRSTEEPHFINIFNIFGQGGVGKTTLTRQFIQIAQQHNARFAYTDEGVKSVTAFMGEVAEQLEKAGCELKEFSKRYKLYRQKKQELEADPDYPQNVGEFIGSTLVRTGTKALKYSVPGAAPILDMIDTDSVAKQVGSWSAFVAKKIGNKDDVLLLREPEKVLTPLWLKEISEITEKHKVFLFVDTYEIVESVLENWLVHLLDDELFSSGIILVISGREKLDPNVWSTYHELSVSIPVDPFTEEEAREYLLRRGITDETLVNSILHVSGRLPVLLATLAEASPNTPEEVFDVSQTAVERFLRWVDDPLKKKVAQYMALPREINQDIIELLMESDENTEEYFNWLSSMPFFEQRGGKNTYHPVVREQMLRNLKMKSPKTWAELHEKLAAYYESQQTSLGLEAEQEIKNESWCQFAREAMYHHFCAHPEKNTPLVVNGFVRHLFEKATLAKLWAETLQDAEADCGNFCSFLKGERLVQFVQDYKENRSDPTIEILAKILKYAKIESSVTSKVYGLRGYEFQLKSDYENAVEDFNKAIELDDKYTFAYTFRGETYHLMNKFDEAISDLNKAIELDDKYSWAYTNRGEIYRQMNKFDEAISDLNKAIELNDKYSWAYANRGETYRQINKFDEAISDLSKSIELDDKFTFAYTYRGETYRQMNKFDEAISDLNKAIELNDKYSWAYASRGETYRQINKFDEAISDLSKSIDLNDKYAWAYASRGETYRQINKFDEAISDFNRALELDDKYAWAYASRGVTYRLMNKFEEAISDLNKAIELNDKYDWAYANRGDTYRQMNKFDEAISDLNKAIELDDKYAWAYLNRGETYRLMNKFDEAISDLNNVIELNNKSGGVYAFRGTIFRLMNKFDQAISDLNKAIELDVNYAWAYENRGETYLWLGHYELAQNDVENALKFSSASNWNQFLLYLINLKLELPDAPNYLVRAVEMAREIIQKEPDNGTAFFNLALYQTVQSDVDDAMALATDTAVKSHIRFLRAFQRDLELVLFLFPDHPAAQTMMAWANERLAQSGNE
ncbi:MAG: tetratricopeptide repeat protein [Bacteroidetes bacterium]|nr:tetratricopeptide repeat protein [Bacteroidota bacterium]